ncbi:KPN_02809 family neutral zinc metallopeptidase [Micromonosporaceae bacterium Da 78-11]
MELNENADIDTSQVEDQRGSGGGGGGGGLGGLPIGGGGLVGIVVTVLIALVGGFFGINSLGGGGESSGTADNTNLKQECAQAEAIKQLDCRNTLFVNSIQAYWADAEPKYFGKDYQKAPTVFFSNRVSTACGAADSGVGPFYCPGDKKVYIDLTFYKQLAEQLGAPGEFAQPYVLAHEYGHHIQDLIGTEAKMRQQQQGASDAEQNLLSVKLELQADCYAGAWAKGATDTKSANGQQIFKTLTAEDIQQGIDTAGKIGDDTLQQRGGGTINPAEFTHGTSADRQKWFSTGYNSGDPKTCDTFAAGAVKAGD